MIELCNKSYVLHQFLDFQNRIGTQECYGSFYS